MNFRGAFLLVLLPLVGACAEYKVSTSTELTNYYALKPTVAGYAEMSFAPLTLPMKQDFEIGRTDGVFDFGGGPSYYKAFALPDASAPYEVVVGSYSMMADCYPCKGSSYFYQKLMLLDASKKPIDGVPARGPDYVPGWSTVSRVTSVALPTHGEARYLIVYTTRDFIENGESHFVQGASTMIMVSPGVFVPISAPGGDQKSPGSPVGHMSVEVKAAGQ